MSRNLTIESPNLEKIEREAGQFTATAINTLWAALNDTRAVERQDFRRASQKLAPKRLDMTPASAVNDLDLEGASILSFTGSTAVNLTGFRAPETGESRILFIHVSGSGTITALHENAGSESANRLSNESAGNVVLSTGKGIIYAYLEGKWREIA